LEDSIDRKRLFDHLSHLFSSFLSNPLKTSNQKVMLNFTSSFTHHHHLLGISQARAAGKEIGDLMTSFQHFEGLDEEEEDLNNSSNNNKNKKRRKVYIYTSPYRRTKQTLLHMLQEIEGIDFCESNDENEEEEEEKEGDYERLKKSERKSDTSCIEV